MYIDCHGHFTTVPSVVIDWRERQVAVFEQSGGHLSPDELTVSDEELVAAIEGGQLAIQQERGTDVTLFSPIAGRMAHHYGDLETSVTWSRVANDLVHRVCGLFPRNFVGVCQLPQSPGEPVDACLDELERCVTELGFVGCNLNPDPSDGYWQAPALTDEHYYPLYERMVELDVPAMVHTAMSCNPAVHATGAHYLNGDTTAFMQFCQSDLFHTFPTLKVIIPHGGGAVPYHWGRYRGLMQDLGRGELESLVLGNVHFDTCVYWQNGLQLLVDTVPAANVLYASEMIGAVKGVDPRTGRRYDDTRFLLDAITSLSESERDAITFGNALRIFGRLPDALRARGYELPPSSSSWP
jgi:4-oxalmesaconate hydratase